MQIFSAEALEFRVTLKRNSFPSNGLDLSFGLWMFSVRLYESNEAVGYSQTFGGLQAKKSLFKFNVKFKAFSHNVIQKKISHETLEENLSLKGLI